VARGSRIRRHEKLWRNERERERERGVVEEEKSAQLDEKDEGKA